MGLHPCRQYQSWLGLAASLTRDNTVRGKGTRDSPIDTRWARRFWTNLPSWRYYSSITVLMMDPTQFTGLNACFPGRCSRAKRRWCNQD